MDSETEERSEAQSAERSVCPQDKIVFDSERAEYICTETGEVLEDRVIATGQEWRAYNAEEFEERARAEAINPNLFANSGFLPTTAIKPKNVKSAVIYSDKQKPLIHGLKFLDLAVQQIGGTDIIREEAGRIFKKLWLKEETHYFGIEIIALISIYLAYRKLKILMSMDDYIEKIEKLFDINRKEFIHAFFRTLGYFEEEIPKFTIETYVKEFGAQLNFPVELIEKALTIAKKVENSWILSGRNPKVSAIAILYMVSKDTQYHIAEIDLAKKFNVSDGAIRKNKQLITKYLEKK